MCGTPEARFVAAALGALAGGVLDGRLVGMFALIGWQVFGLVVFVVWVVALVRRSWATLVAAEDAGLGRVVRWMVGRAWWGLVPAVVSWWRVRLAGGAW